MLPELLLIALLYVIWINYQEAKIVQRYTELSRARKRESRAHPLYPIYPWWHFGFPSGGYTVGPILYNRTQYHHSPRVGWYQSPFRV